MIINKEMIKRHEMSWTYFGVDAGRGELILEHHDDDTEHADDERIVADPLALLEKRFPPAEAVADVGLVLAARRYRRRRARCALGLQRVDAGRSADVRLILRVARVLAMDADQRRRGFLVGDVIVLATVSFHGRCDGQC